MKPSASIAKRGPTNSLGQPYVAGQLATCLRCGLSVTDRDDRPLPGCRDLPMPYGPCDFRFAPPEHHAAIVARRGPR